jgi:hypothetical protein
MCTMNYMVKSSTKRKGKNKYKITYWLAIQTKTVSWSERGTKNFASLHTCIRTRFYRIKKDVIQYNDLMSQTKMRWNNVPIHNENLSKSLHQ